MKKKRKKIDWYQIAFRLAAVLNFYAATDSTLPTPWRGLFTGLFFVALDQLYALRVRK